MTAISWSGFLRGFCFTEMVKIVFPRKKRPPKKEKPTEDAGSDAQETCPRTFQGQNTATALRKGKDRLMDMVSG